MSLTLQIILLRWQRKVVKNHYNDVSLRRPLTFAYLEICIGYSSFRLDSRPQVLFLSTHSTKKPFFVVFLLFGARFGQCINPAYLLMDLQFDQWYRISLNIINVLPYAPHEVSMDSATTFFDTSTPPLPSYIDSYTLVSNIGLVLCSTTSSP